MGTLETEPQGGGDTVKAVFGGPVRHEAAAIEMRKERSHINASASTFRN